MKKAHLGFTLIELMITVGIIGILAAVAYPSYRKQVMRSGRAEARSALLQIQVAQEKFFLQNTPSRYAGGTTAAASVTELNTAPNASPPGLGISSTTSSGYYTITLVTPTGGTTYTATATPNGAQAKDTDCASFTVTETGARDSLNSSSAHTPAICWAK